MSQLFALTSFGTSRRLLPLLLVGMLLAATSSVTLAQDDDATKTPEPEDITLNTKDGVIIHCTWYAGTKGKNTVPVIIVPGWEGNRGQFDALALYLQSKEGGGHAVIVPDLRGQGESMERRLPNGEIETLKPERFNKMDFAAMVSYDMEEVKGHLMKENNQGDLNIELLTVVGADFGALVAAAFAAQDWSWPQLATMKQGQDVKALVLISPPQSFKGMSIQVPLRHNVVQKYLSMLIIAGTGDRNGYNDAKRIHGQLKRLHPDPPPAEVRDKKDLFFGELDTSLSGPQLVAAPSLNVPGMIKTFIGLRLVAKSDDFKWTDRTSPFANN